MIRLPETHIPLDGIYTSSVETENGYDLTIDTELEWGAITENYELEYCLHYAGDSKTLQKRKQGDFPGKTAPRRWTGEDICGDSCG